MPAFSPRYAVFPFVTKARHDARLIVVTPEQRVPGFVVHPLLPVAEEGFQRHEVRLRQRPLFAAGVIHLQMVEVKGHRQLAPVERAYCWQFSSEVEDISPTVIRLRGVKTSRLISCRYS
jgi:hypothetical protein